MANKILPPPPSVLDKQPSQTHRIEKWSSNHMPNYMRYYHRSMSVYGSDKWSKRFEFFSNKHAKVDLFCFRGKREFLTFFCDVSRINRKSPFLFLSFSFLRGIHFWRFGSILIVNTIIPFQSHTTILFAHICQ